MSLLGLARKLPGNEDADTEAIAFAIYGMKLFYCAAPKTSHNYTSSPGVGSQPQPWCHCKLLTHVHHCHLQGPCCSIFLGKHWIRLKNPLELPLATFNFLHHAGCLFSHYARKCNQSWAHKLYLHLLSESGTLGWDDRGEGRRMFEERYPRARAPTPYWG